MAAWQIVLVAIGGFLLLLCGILLFGRASARVILRERLTVTVYAIGIPIKLYVGNTETEKLEPIPKSERKLLRQLKRKKTEKGLLQRLKKKPKKPKEKKKDEPTPNLRGNLMMVTRLAKKAYEVTHGKLKIHVRRMKISVGTGDAASTAILYGVIVQTAAYLLQLIESKFNHIKRSEGDMDIFPDYQDAGCRADLDILCGLRLWTGLNIALKMKKELASSKEAALAYTAIQNEKKKEKAKNTKGFKLWKTKTR